MFRSVVSLGLWSDSHSRLGLSVFSRLSVSLASALASPPPASAFLTIPGAHTRHGPHPPRPHSVNSAKPRGATYRLHSSTVHGRERRGVCLQFGIGWLFGCCAAVAPHATPCARHGGCAAEDVCAHAPCPVASLLKRALPLAGRRRPCGVISDRADRSGCLGGDFGRLSRDTAHAPLHSTRKRLSARRSRRRLLIQNQQTET